MAKKSGKERGWGIGGTKGVSPLELFELCCRTGWLSDWELTWVSSSTSDEEVGGKESEGFTLAGSSCRSIVRRVSEWLNVQFGECGVEE